MKEKKVPLVRYVNGERKIIGEAVVEVPESGLLEVSATVTDPAYVRAISDPHASFSIHTEADTDPLGKPGSIKFTEAVLIEPLRIKGKADRPPGI